MNIEQLKKCVPRLCYGIEAADVDELLDIKPSGSGFVWIDIGDLHITCTPLQAWKIAYMIQEGVKALVLHKATESVDLSDCPF